MYRKKQKSNDISTGQVRPTRQNYFKKEQRTTSKVLGPTSVKGLLNGSENIDLKNLFQRQELCFNYFMDKCNNKCSKQHPIRDSYFYLIKDFLMNPININLPLCPQYLLYNKCHNIVLPYKSTNNESYSICHHENTEKFYLHLNPHISLVDGGNCKKNGENGEYRMKTKRELLLDIRNQLSNNIRLFKENAELAYENDIIGLPKP